MTLMVIALSITTALVYFFKLGKGAGVTYEFLAYALPAFAAIVAGLTAFLKDREVRWFWVSAISVLAGVIIFVVTEGITAVLLWDLVIAYGITAMAFVYPYTGVLARRRGTKRSPLGWCIAVGSLCLVGLGATALYFTHAEPKSGFTKLVTNIGLVRPEMTPTMKCKVLTTDTKTATVVLSCSGK